MSTFIFWILYYWCLSLSYEGSVLRGFLFTLCCPWPVLLSSEKDRERYIKIPNIAVYELSARTGIFHLKWVTVCGLTVSKPITPNEGWGYIKCSLGEWPGACRSLSTPTFSRGGEGESIYHAGKHCQYSRLTSTPERPSQVPQHAHFAPSLEHPNTRSLPRIKASCLHYRTVCRHHSGGVTWAFSQASHLSRTPVERTWDMAARLRGFIISSCYGLCAITSH